MVFGGEEIELSNPRKEKKKGDSIARLGFEVGDDSRDLCSPQQTRQVRPQPQTKVNHSLLDCKDKFCLSVLKLCQELKLILENQVSLQSELTSNVEREMTNILRCGMGFVPSINLGVPLVRLN